MLSLPLIVCVPILFADAKFFYVRRIQGYVLSGAVNAVVSFLFPLFQFQEEHADLIEATVFQVVIALINAVMNIISIILMCRK